MKIIQIITIIAFNVLGNTISYGQAPNWNVNLANFEIRMSVTAILEIDNVDSRDTNDVVAAFVGTEVRGVGKPTVYLPSSDRFLLLFQIGSNIAAGEIVTFKYYDASKNEVVDVARTEVFAADASLGTTKNPYVITKNFFVNSAPKADSAKFSITENSLAGIKIGSVKASDTDADQTLKFKILYTQFDTPIFEIDSVKGEISLILVDSIDYEKKSVYTLKVLVSDNYKNPLSDTSFVTIFIKDIPESQPLPANNYVSPNGDGFNDFFIIDNPEVYIGFTFSILNASGELIFKSDNYQNTWDGKQNGTPLPNGIYYYLFESKQTEVFYKGIISLKSK
ncbi:MAG: gliding motility-associated C-terminal domain-containing protein [Cytophagales bacterium]